MLDPDRPQYNTVRVLCMLDDYGYRHTLRICDTFPRHKNGYAKGPNRYVIPTLPLLKYTNERRGLEQPRKSVYILNQDQVTVPYQRTLKHSQ